MVTESGTVRIATPEDVPILAKLDELISSDARRQALVNRAAAEGKCWICERHEEPTGYAVITQDFFG